MARTNKTDFAVLGMLFIQPMSGYDMRKFIAGSLGFFWQESYGQIYPALKRLRTRKLITRSIEPGLGRPARHVYRLTAAGRKRLDAWLEVPAETEPVRIELLLKLFFGMAGTTARQASQLEEYVKAQRLKLTRLEQIADEVLKPYRGTPAHPYWFSTLRYGILITGSRIAWGEETIGRLRTAKELRSFAGRKDPL